MRNNSNNSVYLRPIDSRKSFYGKAIVKTIPGGVVLQSYNTDVAACINGRFIRLWGDYSATTMRHVNAFAAYCGLKDVGGKKWWDSLKVESI